jgi:hypothetical protein
MSDLNLLEEFEIELSIDVDSDDQNDAPDCPPNISYIQFSNLLDYRNSYSFSNKIHTNNTANKLVELYNHKQFYKLVDQIERLRTEKYFFSEYEDLTICIDIFNKYVKIKQWLRKIFYRRALAKCKQVVNTTDLCFVDLHDRSTVFHYHDIENSSIYLFTRTDLIRVLKMALLNNQFEFPNAYSPRNPYTNLEFNTKSLVEIVNYLEIEYRKIGKCLPNYIVYFKNSYYDIDLYYRNYMSNHVYRCYKNYIDELVDSDWFSEFIQFVRDNMLYSLFCKQCLLDTIGPIMIRKLVSPVLAIYYLNNIGDRSMGDAVEIYRYICNEYKIHYAEGHYKTHQEPRRILRARRRPIIQIGN